VAQSRGDKDALAQIASGVLGAKLTLLSGFLAIVCVAAVTVENFRLHPGYLALAIIQALAFGFSPFWYFQGTEHMIGAVLVEFFARAAAAASIFLLVRGPEDGWKALASLAAAGCAMVLIQTPWMYSEIDFRWPRWENSWKALQQGWHMFVFRGAYNIYGTANAFILGLFASPAQVGFFGGAERIAKALQGTSLPFAQAFYPHMSGLASHYAAKAGRLARWTICLAGAAGFALAVALGLLASRAVSLILGPSYGESVRVLHIFALILPLNALNTALIMHWMLPHGMERTVGAVTLAAIVINVLFASLLAPRLAHAGMAWAILVAESCQTAALGFALFRSNVSLVSVLREPKSRPIQLS